jgi:hypothetical protein
MRTLAWLGFVLVVTSANAQTATSVDRETHTVRTSPEHPASSKTQAAHSTTRATSITTVAHPGGGDQPKGDSGDQPAPR